MRGGDTILWGVWTGWGLRSRTKTALPGDMQLEAEELEGQAAVMKLGIGITCTELLTRVSKPGLRGRVLF